MPRKAVTTTYSKAGGRKMKKTEEVRKLSQAFVPKMRKPEPLTPLTAFVKGALKVNKKISTLDLLHQYQEDVCEHGAVQLAKAGNYNSPITVSMCPSCGLVNFHGKPKTK